MGTGTAGSNWFYAQRGAQGRPGAAGAPARIGPLTWEQLWAEARAGRFGPSDLVWNPQYPDWLEAGRIPGLFLAGAPGGSAAAAGGGVAAPRGAAGGPPAARRRSSRALVIALIAVVVVIGGGLGAYFGFLRDRGDDGKVAVSSSTSSSATVTSSTSAGDDTTTTAGATTSSTQPDGKDLGAADVKLPDENKLILTKDWGVVPANQVGVMLAAGKTRADADGLASSLGGTVVGEVEFVNLYQIETAAESTEDGLRALLDKAAAMPGVETAFPNIRVLPHTEVWGLRTPTALADPAYAENRDAGLLLIGADLAWMYVKASGLELSPVRVGIIDSGLYQDNGEFEGGTKVSFPEGGKPLDAPALLVDHGTGKSVKDPAGSHGTMITNMIAADPKNGGVSGIASTALGDNLTVSFIDSSSGRFGSNWQVRNPEPGDPTIKTNESGESYAVASLVAITKQIEAGATVINCSWGAAAPNAANAAVYKNFFTQMAQQHPDVLFVCSAGNTGGSVDGSQWFPGGLKLPNMITVGNLMNDGSTADSSTRANTTSGQEYEVTLAAPGEEAVQGVGDDGKAVTDATDLGLGGTKRRPGGTSLATPMVSSAAAILLALDPTLKAKDIKEILTSTAGSGPSELGGKTLSIGKAVLKVINKLRVKSDLTSLTLEQLAEQLKADFLKNGIVDAVATGDPATGIWTVSASIPAPTPTSAGTKLTLTHTDGVTITGNEEKGIAEAVPVTWENVDVDKDGTQTITVTRDDTGMASVITLPPDLNGKWEGTFTITKIDLQTMEAEMSVEFMGCDPNSVDWEEFLKFLANTPLPAKLEIKVDPNGVGTAVMTVDASPLKAKAAAQGQEIDKVTSTPVKFKLVYKDYKAYFATESGQDVGQASMTVPIGRPLTGVLIQGKMISDNQGIHMEADCKFTKLE